MRRTKLAFWRCNSGHYFRAEACPLDGSRSRESVELDAAAKRIVASGGEPSISALADAGVSDDAIRKCIVIEFGQEESSFEVLAPEGYVVDGRFVKQRD